MPITSRAQDIAWTVLLWTMTVLAALGIGLAGAGKLHEPNQWQQLFTEWGYPAWCSMAIGVVEVAGAIALCVPRIAFYGAGGLASVMTGALVTLTLHPGGKLGRGATPALYLVLISGVVFIRWRQRARLSRPDL